MAKAIVQSQINIIKYYGNNMSELENNENNENKKKEELYESSPLAQTLNEHFKKYHPDLVFKSCLASAMNESERNKRNEVQDIKPKAAPKMRDYRVKGNK